MSQDLSALRNYTGTPKGFVEAFTPFLATYGGVKVFQSENVFGLDGYRVEVVTGGYSDHEEVASLIENSFFGFCFWESIHRGGLFVYEISADQWETNFGALGKRARETS